MIHQQGLSKNGAACPARTCRGGTGPQQSCMKPLETHRHVTIHEHKILQGKQIGTKFSGEVCVCVGGGGGGEGQI